jgi:NAD-dependent deacetylase
MNPEALTRAAEVVATARRVVVSSGAGMSKESGIPTFRDAREGLWSRFDPERLATEAGFRADPALVWTWYAQRRAAMARCEPHPGHHALVRLEASVPELTVVTQNIDGLHQRAGSRDVVELHGSIHRHRCVDCQRFAEAPLVEPAGGADLEPPRCPECGSFLRPDVVWFGEMLPARAVERAWELVERCEVLLVVGTSGLVWPAAELPYVARRSGATVIEVNPEPSEVTGRVDIFLPGPAGEVIPPLAERVLRERAG